MSKIHCLTNVLIFLLVGCSNPTPKLPLPITHAPLYYVLCDFSASQGDLSKRTIIGHAEKLFQVAVMHRGRIIYYNVSDGRYVSPFFDYQSAVGDFIKPGAKMSEQAATNKMADSLHKSLLIVSETSPRNTCIVGTIDKVAEAMSRDIEGEKETTVIGLVILSDLLEDCSYGPVRMNIDKGDFKTAFHKLQKMPPPSSDFSMYKHINISLVAASQRSVAADSLNLFWHTTFKRLNYDLPTISVTLPKWAQEKQVKTF